MSGLPKHGDIVLKRIHEGSRSFHADVVSQDWYGGLLTHLQRSTSRTLKQAVGDVLAQHVRWYTREFDIPDADADEPLAAKADELRARGYTIFDLSPAFAEAVIRSLAGSTFVNMRVQDERFAFGAVDLASLKMTTYTNLGTNILRYPPIAQIAANRQVLQVVRRHLGALPRLAGFEVNLNLPERIGETPSSDWHFDKGSISFVKMFIYLNDVGPETGPHGFVAGSHDAGQVRQALERRLSNDPQLVEFMLDKQRWTDEEVDGFFPDAQIHHCGPAGTAILEDTRGFHRATPVVKGHRLMITLQWALDPCTLDSRPEPVALESLPEAMRPRTPEAERRFRYIFEKFVA